MKHPTYWAFLWAWLNRALTDAARFFGWNLKAILVPLVLLIAGFAFQWKLRGISETKDDVAKFLITTASPLIIFLSCLIFYNLLKAPYLLYSDEQGIATATISDTSNKLTAATDRARSAEQALAAQVTVNTHLREEAAKSATRPSPPPAPAGARGDIKPIRDAIAKLMEEGNILAASCLVAEEKPELITKTDDWANRTYKYLQSFDAGDAARFNAAQIPIISHTGVNIKNDNAWKYLAGHVQVLGQILSELREQ